MKKGVGVSHYRLVLSGIILSGILFLTFWIRLQVPSDIPVSYFTSQDAYLFRNQINQIVEHGFLSNLDTNRWFPLGRDNTQLLSLYPYVIVNIHKIVAWVFPNITTYNIQLYAPTVCFTLGVGILFLFLLKSYGCFYAAIVTLFLATMPGSIDRSSVGFSDRDSWCWLLAIVAILSYLTKEDIHKRWQKYVLSIISGISVFCGGMSWEGFGVFVLVIITVEFWTYCTTYKTEHSIEYFLWILMFVPWVYMISPAYHSGYGFSTHITALLLYPSIILGLLHGIRYIILTKIRWDVVNQKIFPYTLSVLAFIVGCIYIYLQIDTFEETVYAFHESRLMETVSELGDPDLKYWKLRYGSVFVLGSIGLIIATLQMWKVNGIFTAFSLAFFSILIFLQEEISYSIGVSTSNKLFLLSLAMNISGIAMVSLRKEEVRGENTLIMVIVWFLLWVGFTSTAKRHDFFIGLPLAYGTAWIIWHAPLIFIKKMKEVKILHADIKEKLVTPLMTIVLLVGILFYRPIGGFVSQSHYDKTIERSAIPRTTSMRKALNWINMNISDDSVVAAGWSCGNQLRVFGDVRTITDADHYIPNWIHLYFRNVFCGQSEQEALEFLMAHGVTHIMITENELLLKARNYSYISSNLENDRFYEFVHLQILPKNKEDPQRIANLRSTPYLFIEAIKIENDPPPNYLKALKKDKSTVNLPYIIYKDNKPFIVSETISSNVNTNVGGVILFYATHDSDEHQEGEHLHLYRAEYVPPLGWNIFAFNLFYKKKYNEAFVQVYPTSDNSSHEVRIWEIKYPDELKVNPKYLLTGYPHIDKDLLKETDIKVNLNDHLHDIEEHLDDH